MVNEITFLMGLDEIVESGGKPCRVLIPYKGYTISINKAKHVCVFDGKGNNLSGDLTSLEIALNFVSEAMWRKVMC